MARLSPDTYSMLSVIWIKESLKMHLQNILLKSSEFIIFSFFFTLFKIIFLAVSASAATFFLTSNSATFYVSTSNLLKGSISCHHS
jgi:hypothetical protein